MGAASASGPEVVVGSELDYPPYAMVDQKGEADGFSVDLMKAVCDVVGLTPTFRVGPWSQIRAALVTGEVDALPFVAYSRDREGIFDFSPPHTVAHAAIFKRKDTPDIDREHGLRGKAIIVVRAGGPHEWLLRNDVSDRITVTDTIGDSLRLLAVGEHDYAILAHLTGLQVVREQGLAGIEVTGPPLDIYGRGYGFAVKKGNARLLQQLSDGLAVVRQNGRYDELHVKWFGVAEPQKPPLTAILAYLVCAGCRRRRHRGVDPGLGRRPAPDRPPADSTALEGTGRAGTAGQGAHP